MYTTLLKYKKLWKSAVLLFPGSDPAQACESLWSLTCPSRHPTIAAHVPAHFSNFFTVFFVVFTIFLTYRQSQFTSKHQLIHLNYHSYSRLATLFYSRNCDEVLSSFELKWSFKNVHIYHLAAMRRATIFAMKTVLPSGDSFPF